mgnify:CR=1 FL=1
MSAREESKRRLRVLALTEAERRDDFSGVIDVSAISIFFCVSRLIRFSSENSLDGLSEWFVLFWKYSAQIEPEPLALDDAYHRQVGTA